MPICFDDVIVDNINDVMLLKIAGITQAALFTTRPLGSAFTVRYQVYCRYVEMGGFPELVILYSFTFGVYDRDRDRSF